jgi:DNA-binding Lrp family transcriptional regulator
MAVTTPPPPVDTLDARLIALLAEEPRIGVLECARRLGVARGTVQARLDRLTRRGVVRGFGPDIAPAALGFGVTAFVTLEITQSRGHDPASAHLAAIPEVLEVHTITGSGDLLCRIVARSNAEQIPYRTLPLVRAAAGGTVTGGPVTG